MKKIIAIIGDNSIETNGLKEKIAFSVGKALIDSGYRIQSGGMGGVMKASFLGARSSENYQEGDIIAMIPSFDKNQSNGLADIIIPTGLDINRASIAANADFVVAIGGGAGTLAEIASAWMLMRPIAAFNNVEGWSKKVAGTKLDTRIRYKFEDHIYSVSSAKELLEVISEKIELYDKYHHNIIMEKNK
ncbi:MAG: acyl-CoA synthetase [Candidatus Izimaplasma sp.]|nr:acyl-CoA synthetase [Candidatus Izimaplasma bacterium]